MKLMIMTDLEGVAGILNFEDWCVPESMYYDKAKRLLTLEVNAAVDGFCEGGAEEILVVDGHGHGAMDPELLDERAQLMRGHADPIWPWNLDESYQGLAYVGQHAKAGTPYSHLTHTGSFACVDYAINGISIGEYGQLVLCAMELGVPTIFAAGEEAFAGEAESLTPGVVTVGVKRGLLPDGLEDLDADAYSRAKLSAVNLAPARSRALIRNGALAAMEKLKADPSSFRYPEMSPPYVRTSRYRRRGDTPGFSTRDEHPDSIIGLMNTSPTRVA